MAGYRGRHETGPRPRAVVIPSHLADLSRSVWSRFTFTPANDWVSAWSPDGTRIVFTSERESPGVAHLYEKPTGGGAEERLLLKTDEHKHHLHWSRDGRFIVYESTSATNATDLWILPMQDGGEPQVYLQTPFTEGQPQFSPDGRFLAYISNESGRFEVYARAFPATDSKWRISTAGSPQPRWRADGRELYYLPLAASSWPFR